jgi:hypothetical protein
VIQTQYDQVKTYPFCNEHERVVMTLFALAIHLGIRIALKPILPEVSQLPFYLLVLIQIYAVKIAVDVFMVSAYKSVASLAVAVVLNVAIMASSVVLGSTEGVYDQSLQREASDLAKYIEIIMGNNSIGFLNRHSVMLLVAFINFFITLAAIPTVVKFGNWYTKTLKEVYYEDDSAVGNSKLQVENSQQSRQ